MKDDLKANVNLWITVRDPQGKIVKEDAVHNLVVTSGRNLIRDFLFGDAVDPLSHLAVGTGLSDPVITDASLGSEVYRAVFSTSNKTNLKITYTLFLGTGTANGNYLSEAGLFNHAVSGTMYSRAIYAPIDKTSAITVTYTWEITWS